LVTGVLDDWSPDEVLVEVDDEELDVAEVLAAALAVLVPGIV
jgi:hypothetical protein